jgi:hypothetical protein
MGHTCILRHGVTIVTSVLTLQWTESLITRHIHPRRHIKYFKHYATSRKVTGSRPDEVNKCFQFT